MPMYNSEITACSTSARAIPSHYMLGRLVGHYDLTKYRDDLKARMASLNTCTVCKIVIALNTRTNERPLCHQMKGHSVGPCDGKKYTEN